MSNQPLKPSGTNSGMTSNDRNHNSYDQFNIGITDALGTGSPAVFRLVGGRATSGGEAFTHNDAVPFQFSTDGKLQVDTEISVSGVEINNIKVYSPDGTVASTVYGKTDANGVVWTNLAQVGSTVTNVNGGGRNAGTQTTTLADDDPAVLDLKAISGLDFTRNVSLLSISGTSHTTSVDVTAISGLNVTRNATLLGISGLDVTRNASLIDISGNTTTIAGWDNATGDGASVTGDVAHDGVDAGEPIKFGGRAGSALPTAVANADRVNAYFDLNGRLRTFDEGGASVLPVTHQNPQDFSVAYTSSTTLTLTGAPFTVDDSECFVAYIYYKPIGGNWQSALVNGVNSVSLTASSNVVTIVGGGTPFASADEYLVGIVYQNKGYSAPNDAQQSIELSPLSEQYVGEVLVSGAALISGTTYYYLDMAGYRKSAVQIEVDDIQAGSVELTYEGTLQDDGTAAASCSYQDITNDVFGIGSQFAVSGTSNTIADMWVDNSEKTSALKYGRIKLGLTNGSTGIMIFAKRWY